MTNSEKNLSQSTLEQFDNYKSLVSAEIELIQRILEIRQNFSNSGDLQRIIAPILRRISKIKSEKLVFEQNFNLI